MRLLHGGAILFDLDGVLVNSRANIERHWQVWAQQRGLDFDEIVRTSHGRRALEVIQSLAPHLPAAAEAQALSQREAEDTDGVEPIPGAADLLAALPAQAWAIVTSGTRAIAIARLRHVGLPLPAVLVTADDVSQGKPDPEGYLQAAERLGIAAPHCLVIEDAPPGIQAAQAAGMAVIGVATTYPASELWAANARVQALAEIRLGPLQPLGHGETRLELWLPEQ